jgi:hypothetical protein
MTTFFRALLTSELETIFDNAPLAPNALAHGRVQEAYLRATASGSSSQGSGSSGSQENRRVPEKDDDCPICYETMYNVALNKLTFCDQCGNALHNECFQQCMSAHH